MRAAQPHAGLTCTRVFGELAAPRDVIEARDGTLFVTEMAGGRISQLAPGTTSFVPFAVGLVTPIGIREASDGSLVVAEEVAHRVSRIDRATATRTTLAEELGGVTYLTLDSRGTSDADGGPSGAVYVSSFAGFGIGEGAIRKLTFDGAPSTVFAPGLSVPEGIAFEGAGADARLVVAEWGATPSRLVAVTNDPARNTIVADGFQKLYGVAYDARRSGFVIADVAGNRVVFVRKDGTTLDLLTGVAAPAGVSITSRGDILVAEHVDGDRHDARGYVIRLSGTFE